MATEIIGKCYICKRELTRHDISHKDEGQERPVAHFYRDWPGDGVACTEQPGVAAEYDSLLEEADGATRTDSSK